MTKKRVILREFSRSKRSKSRDKENPDSIRFSDTDFTSPIRPVLPQQNRPRVSEFHPNKRRLVDYSDSESDSQGSQDLRFFNNNNENEPVDEIDPTEAEIEANVPENEVENDENQADNGYNFAMVDPYLENPPKITGWDMGMATRFTGRTIRERKEAWVREIHPLHARYLDATDRWKTDCFVKGLNTHFLKPFELLLS